MTKKSTIKKNEIKVKNKKPIKVEKVKKEKKFLISARKLFITFSPCNIPIDEILKEFKIKLKKLGIAEFLIIREESEQVDNSDFHVHLYFELKQKCQFRSPDFLHVGELKGNYQGVKSKINTIQYILKNMNERENPDVILFSSGIGTFLTKHCDWLSEDQYIIKQAKEGKIPETMLYLETNNPTRYFKEGKQIEKRMREIRLGHLGFITKFNLKEFIIPEKFKNEMFSKDILEGRITPFIIGPSGCGKSNC